MIPNHNLKMADLLQAFQHKGYAKSQGWVYRQEAKGNLIVMRSTTDFKRPQGTRPKGAVRIFTQEQIEKIVNAFVPGGSGFYDYRKDREV